MRALLAFAVFVLAVYALVDCLRTRRSDIRTLPKPAWLLVILVPAVGPLAWLVAGRRRGPSSPPARGRGPVAPDDDPEFLWRLEQQRRRGRDGGGPDTPPGTTGPAPA